MSPEKIQEYLGILITETTKRAPTVIWALLTLIIWLWIIGKLTKLVKKWFETSKLDPTVSGFLASIAAVLMKVLLLVSVAGMFGIETTSFIAMLWAAWLAVGMALQGSLSNFAWGVLTLVFKPYKVGDLIETQGVFGKVEEIQMFVTKISTPDNKTAIVPNGPIANGNIINYTEKGEIRVDVNVGIAYDEDIDNARAVLEKVIKTQPALISEHPGSWVFVNELADSSVNLIVRWFSAPGAYRDAYFGLTEWSKKALDREGISIPFPHRVVHTTSEGIE